MVLPVNAWNTADRYVVPYRRDPLATDGLEPARQETCGFPSAVELRLSAFCLPIGQVFLHGS